MRLAAWMRTDELGIAFTLRRDGGLIRVISARNLNLNLNLNLQPDRDLAQGLRRPFGANQGCRP